MATDLFEKSKSDNAKKHEKSINVNKAKVSKRYGTKKPVEKFNVKQVEWREDL